MKSLRIIAAALVVCIPFTVNAQFMMFGGGGNRASQDSLRKIINLHRNAMLILKNYSKSLECFKGKKHYLQKRKVIVANMRRRFKL